MISHGDPALVKAVQKGRREEFASFGWADAVPDPQAEETFRRSRIDHGLREKGEHKALFDFYRELIRIRKSQPLILEVQKTGVQVQPFEKQNVLAVQYGNESGT